MDIRDRVFYHIYPLGFCGAPRQNDFRCPAGPGLRKIREQIPRLLDLGTSALYIGPLFESAAHGYDSLDLFHVDRRLGNNAELRDLVRDFHEAGILVMLDAVLNHAGRHFFAFRDLRERGESSPYRDWFSGVDFGRRSPLDDPFSYDTWSGAWELPKFNGRNRELRAHLFDALKFWIDEFDVDGLRLDAADQLLPDFMDEFSARAKAEKQDFWLLGEVVAGDYRNWARPGRLDSVTNYELYKSLWSSFNDRNFHELAWTLNREFGTEGLYRDIPLYNFADNHDVDRLASTLKNPAHLFPLCGLLFTVPGVPSLYYGSEYGVRGKRTQHDDRVLRPAWRDSPENWPAENSPAVDPAALKAAIRRFAALRKQCAALRRGSYRELLRAHGQFAFLREDGDSAALVAANADGADTRLRVPGVSGRWRDILNGGEFAAEDGSLELPVHPSWLAVLEKIR